MSSTGLNETHNYMVQSLQADDNMRGNYSSFHFFVRIFAHRVTDLLFTVVLRVSFVCGRRTLSFNDV